MSTNAPASPASPSVALSSDSNSIVSLELYDVLKKENDELAIAVQELLDGSTKMIHALRLARKIIKHLQDDKAALIKEKKLGMAEVTLGEDEKSMVTNAEFDSNKQLEAKIEELKALTKSVGDPLESLFADLTLV